MIYIRRLELVDENDEIIYKAKHISATKGLSIALKIVKEKGGIKEKLQQLDEEFKEYFNFG